MLEIEKSNNEIIESTLASRTKFVRVLFERPDSFARIGRFTTDIINPVSDPTKLLGIKPFIKSTWLTIRRASSSRIFCDCQGWIC